MPENLRSFHIRRVVTVALGFAGATVYTRQFRFFLYQAPLSWCPGGPRSPERSEERPGAARTPGEGCWLRFLLLFCVPDVYVYVCEILEFGP